MTSFPEWLVPMAATLTQERFTGPGMLKKKRSLKAPIARLEKLTPNPRSSA